MQNLDNVVHICYEQNRCCNLSLNCAHCFVLLIVYSVTIFTAKNDELSIIKVKHCQRELAIIAVN